jgi:hypothetical protein
MILLSYEITLKYCKVALEAWKKHKPLRVSYYKPFLLVCKSIWHTVLVRLSFKSKNCWLAIHPVKVMGRDPELLWWLSEFNYETGSPILWLCYNQGWWANIFSVWVKQRYVKWVLFW